MKNSCKKIHCSLGALDRTAEGAAAQSHTGHVGRFGFEDSLPMGSSRGKPNNWELAAGLTRDQETSLLCALIAFTYGPRSCRIIISEDPALKARLAGYFEQSSLLKFCYKFINKILPVPLLKIPIKKNSQFHDYNTRHNNNLSTSSYKHSFSQKFIQYAIIKCVNDLPADIRSKLETHSLSNICLRFKIPHINSYITCSISNCYVCANVF